MKWFEIKIKTTTEAIEAVSNILYDFGISGVVIEDPKDPAFTSKDENGWDYIDDKIMKFEYEGALVKGYLSEDDDLQHIKESVEKNITKLKEFNIDYGVGEVSICEVFEEDWANEWKKYYKPTRVTEHIVIKPTWEPYEPEKDDLVIEMDPGGAFGTGTHETTKMCIQALEKYVKPDTSVYDIGCGSGILAIAAAKLGANKVYAVDLDEAAVEATNENVILNKVESKVNVLHGNLMDLLSEPADIVVANIVADIIIFLSESIKTFMHKDSIFISSGIILNKKNEVVSALEKNGLEIISVVEMGEWVSVTCRIK